MTTTNARTLRDENPDDSQHHDLKDLTVDDGNNQQQNNQKRRNKAQQIHDTDDADLPKEFQGKSVNELVGMLQEKEKMIGRQANEIGHLRDLSDQLLNSQTHSASATAHSQSQDDSQQAPEITSDDLFENPQDAISRAVSPMIESAVSEIKESVGGLQASTAAQEFEKRHPTYQEDMQNEDFQKFVQASQYRSRLAAKAHQNNDFEAADELWTAWEEYQSQTSGGDELEDEANKEQHQQHDQRQQQLRDASTVRSGNGERGGGGSGNKPVYSARKLQEYRNRDPDGYYDPNFQAEILAAFRDGRVK